MIKLKMIIMYPLIMVLIITEAHKRTTRGGLRVYQGQNDTTSQYPYVVCLKGGDNMADIILRICTGSLITEVWVLTASHCLLDIVEYIQYGNMTIPLIFTRSKSRVLRMIPHPRYIEAMTINDIGLMLVTPVLMKKYGRLSAIDYKTLTGQVVEYAGYGQTFLDDGDAKGKMLDFIMDMLRPLQVGQAIVSECDEDYLSRNLICLSSKCSHKQTVLPGDSGGPLISGGKIIAVACAITSDYSAQSFTPVSPHLNWIHKVISSENP